MDIRHDSDVALDTWLKDNHLNDRTVAALRDNGCDTMENLRSLHPEDLPTLGLPIGQQRRLEDALHMDYTQRNGNSSQPPAQSQPLAQPLAQPPIQTSPSAQQSMQGVNPPVQLTTQPAVYQGVNPPSPATGEQTLYHLCHAPR